jgi:hypothetical protein
LAVVTELLRVFFSPIGPALVLLMGAALQLIVGRWLRRAVLVRGMALLVVAVAALLFLLLQFLSVTPTLGQPWQPLLQTSINLFWISDGWNNYIAGLILLLGGLGVLLDRAQRGGSVPVRFYTVQAMNLAILAASQLFVTSGNLLTALFAWVFLDFTVLLRTAAEPAASDDEGAPLLRTNEAQLLSLVGALILLIGLLPAGATGPAQEFTRGVLPTETLIALLAAAAIRTGVYPVHLWLLPRRRAQVILSERLLGHMAPMLCGLWLFGWTYHLGGAALLTTPLAVLTLTLLLLASAIAAWTADDQPHHATFVLVTAAGVAVLAGVLAHTPGPAGIVWATTAFALGGGLWLVGDQVWQAWGWQAPVTVGAAALAGVAFTPGFLAQPALASLLTRGPLFWPAAVIFILAMSIQIAALLRSWSAPDHAANGDLPQDFLVRLLVACVALGSASRRRRHLARIYGKHHGHSQHHCADAGQSAVGSGGVAGLGDHGAAAAVRPGAGAGAPAALAPPGCVAESAQPFHAVGMVLPRHSLGHRPHGRAERQRAGRGGRRRRARLVHRLRAPGGTAPGVGHAGEHFHHPWQPVRQRPRPPAAGRAGRADSAALELARGVGRTGCAARRNHAAARLSARHPCAAHAEPTGGDPGGGQHADAGAVDAPRRTARAPADRLARAPAGHLPLLCWPGGSSTPASVCR